MAIIATVGRRSFAVMALVVSMYVLLTAGGITMVYPFLLMVSTATTTGNDMQEYRLVPTYVHNDNALYRKYLWLRYDTGIAGAARADYNKAYYKADVSQFRLDEHYSWGDRKRNLGLAKPPAVNADDADVRRRAADLDRFLKESAVLWPGPPLMETVTAEPGGDKGQRRELVRDPYGRPLDPAGLTTGLGNYYRTVGYIGNLYNNGFTGIGRDQWAAFLEQFYTDPANPRESSVERVKRAMARHGRPYERIVQACPGYDMPASPSWSIIEGEYVQSDWLYYKAVWLTGAPVVTAQGESAEGPAIAADAAKMLGRPVRDDQAYTDVLGRSHRWTAGGSLRPLRPTQILPDFWLDLKDRHVTVEGFNLAIGLARQRASSSGPDAKPVIELAGRDVLLAQTLDLARLGGTGRVVEPKWFAVLRALAGGVPATAAAPADPADYHYLLPPRFDPALSKLTFAVGVNERRLGLLNGAVERLWLAALKARGYRAVHLPAFAEFNEVYVSSRRPIYEPLAAEWDKFVAAKVPAAMIQPIDWNPTSQPADPGPPDPAKLAVTRQAQTGALAFDAARNHLRLPAHAWRDFLGWLYGGPGAALDKDPAAAAQRRAEFRRLYLGNRSEAEVDDLVRRGRMLYGQEFDEFNLAAMPIVDRDVVEFAGHKGELRRHFLLGNFTVVLDELVLQGRAMFNTIVLIFLAIATHITVNPLAAYALSRFRLTYTYKVLLFLLATMAFPPAVGMIPSFLLLKNLGLINSYAALVLPGIASGYTIFLLKGFFDALPQELYEAAEIDGAGKITTFLNVTFPLSKPIFAIMTLNAFTAAYSGFMWAFLICPDSRMWTIMVHLFQLQQTATAPISMAALVIGAIPTFLVFLFCQNVILRGIIIPSFK